MVAKERVRQLNQVSINHSGPVVYVMGREQRVHDNWALLYAQELALQNCQPLFVLFALGDNFLSGAKRHNDWLIASLQEVESNLEVYQIPFFVIAGNWVETVKKFVKHHQVGAVILDFNPIMPVRSWRDVLAKTIPVAVFEVDARNIVPCWLASPKEEFAAYTFRPKINQLLSQFLVPYPKLKKCQNLYQGELPNNDWNQLSKFRKINQELPLIEIITAGETAAKKQLRNFLQTKLQGYALKRNDPNLNSTSNLSPYLRWGNISSATVALAVKAAPGNKTDKDTFLEELIVRRELADNFVFYNPNYNLVIGAHIWAKSSIQAHAKDKREYLYTYEEFAQSRTHDDLWNAAQTQMVREGKMHGYLRMYWAKKILEWTTDAQNAIDIALKLNDTYNLDGRDSNGVVGVMWSVCGVHDRAWNDRPIFGKIRYMNFNGCKRKFDVAAFITRYSHQPKIL